MEPSHEQQAAGQPPSSSEATPSATVEVAPPPADPPRELSAAVRRRTWTEPRVRLWWVLALGVLLAVTYVTLSAVGAWLAERRLLTDGVKVDAVITAAEDRINLITVPDKNMPSDSRVTLEFTLDGKKYTVRGFLAEARERRPSITTGPKHPIPIRVDPADPSRWTDRTEMPPMVSRQFIGVFVGLPIALLLLLLAFMKRSKATDVWRNGRAAPALVLGTGQTPVAPRSAAVRCTPADSNDKRVFTVYLPAGAPAVVAGDVLWVVRPPDRPEPAYAASWFNRDGDKNP